jgi:hypothetical protein
LANILLTDKLPADLHNEIATLIHKRITQSYLSSCKGDNKRNLWIKGTSNWNTVSTSGLLFVTITNSADKDERIAAVGSALNNMKYYLSGFKSHGYCSEGQDIGGMALGFTFM